MGTYTEATNVPDLFASGTSSPERRANVQRAVHFESEHSPVTNGGVGIPHLKPEEVEKNSREDLHLPVRELLSQTDARPRLRKRNRSQVKHVTCLWLVKTLKSEDGRSWQ